MKSCQFLFRRHMHVKRVASVCSISLAVSLAACSSQGLSLEETGSSNYAHNTRGTVLIPSEPVYGYPDKDAAASDHRAPFNTADASLGASAAPTSIQRTSLAPVRTASYDAPAGGNYLGNSYAMGPVTHDGGGAEPHSAAGPRYAQAGPPVYYDRSQGYKPPYYDHKPERPRYDAPPPEDHHASHDGDGDGGYVVVQGDTLFGISKRLGISARDLAELNGLTGATIYAGQRLRVRGGPKYTAASEDHAPRHYDAPSPAEDHRARHYEAPGRPAGYDRYADDDRKAPPPDYSSYRDRNSGTSYSDYKAHRKYEAEANVDAEDDRPDDRPNDRYDARPSHEDRYASRYEPPANYRRDERHVREYRKPKEAYDTYSVQRGDTLYTIAERNGVSHRELADYNDVPPNATLYPGQVLHIPKGRGYDWGRNRRRDDGEDYSNRRSPPRDDRGGYGRRVPYSQNAPEKKPGAEERRVAKADVPVPADREKAEKQPAPKAEPASAPAEEKRGEPVLAAHRDVDPKAGQPAAADDTKACQSLLTQPVARSDKTFREPVQGLIVAKFGTSKDGTFNDGIDFSVPKGTPVKAAENGVVAYAGNELPGFGNLVLVRHADGYVTAYAHNEELMVNRCDIVKRGQIIAKAGATGKVTQPQLHFELRKDSKAVDPEGFFSRS